MPSDLPIAGVTVPQLRSMLFHGQSPGILDVCVPEDAEALGHLVPGSRTSPHRNANADRPTMVVCAHGLKLSQGVAARLRGRGVRATFLQGGLAAWLETKEPALLRPRAVDTGPICIPNNRLPVAAHLRWLISRLLSPEAEILSADGAVIPAIADRFSGIAVTSAETFAELFLRNSDLGGFSHVTSELDAIWAGLVSLHGPGEDAERAALPILDAAFRGQSA